jgi:RNA polymerase sigma factor (sigma-70 family)
MTADEARALLVESLPLIDRITRSICRRSGIDHSESEDFASVVRLKLVENDYAAIRSFEGRCSLSTWLMVLARRVLLDYRNHRWGKWRPSAEATRLGGAATLVERVVRRDGGSIEDAARLIREEQSIEMSEAEIEGLLARLPARTPRPHEEPLGVAAEGRDPSLDPEAAVLSAEAGRLSQHASRILSERLARLDAEDRLLVRMRFFDGLPVPRIARATGTDQRRLYHRISKIGDELRIALEQGGVDRGAIRSILDEGADGLSVRLAETPEISPSTHRGELAPTEEGIGER